MALGAVTPFDRALLKFNTAIQLNSDSFKAVLCGSAQALDPTFVGASGDCRYVDLTAELATANGYTVGGATMTSVGLSRKTAPTVGWDATVGWTPTGPGLTFKYLVIYDNTAGTKDLVAFADMDTTGGTYTALAGSSLIFSPNAAGLMGYSR